MEKLFLQVVNMSITATYIILLIVMVRLFLKKAPKIFSYLLWMIPFIRLAIPISIESVFSLIAINKETIPTNIIYNQTPHIQSGITALDATVNKALTTTAATSGNPIHLWVSVGSKLWVFGIILLLGFSVLTTLRLLKKLQSASLVKNNVYKTDLIETPFVFGLIKPKIYLPMNLTEKEEAYIINHEETHIRRFDHIIKFFAFIIVFIHWFNPVVWLAFFLMSDDMELSCDEAVIQSMGKDVKKDYSSSLLSLASGKQIIGGCPVAFGQNNPKGRIKNILNYKKPKTWVVIIGIMVVLGLTLGFLSNRPILFNNKIDEALLLKEAKALALDEAKLISDQHGFTINSLEGEVMPSKDADVLESIKAVSIQVGYPEDNFKKIKNNYEIVRFNVLEMSKEKEKIYLDVVVANRKVIGAALWVNDHTPKVNAITYQNFILDVDHIQQQTLVVTDTDLADDLIYHPQEKQMYISNLKTIEEFSVKNEGSVAIDLKQNILILQITKATGSVTGAVDGPRVHFVMDLNTYKIIEKEFIPAPNYDQLGLSELSEYSEEVVELSNARLVEIGKYFETLMDEFETE